MKSTRPNLSELTDENRRLRGSILRASQLLDDAAAQLRLVLGDEAFVEETPLEVQYAMSCAADAIESVSVSLNRSTARRTARPISGGPTVKQGQFLAYIREYMLGNRRGVAPTHAEFQKFFNLTPPSVNSMLKRLTELGFIRRVPREPRAIELVIDPEQIPPLDRPFKQ